MSDRSIIREERVIDTVRIFEAEIPETPKKIFLSSLGWVQDYTVGNFLRWNVESDFLKKMGLPDQFIIERAEMEPQKYPEAGARFTVPDNWWKLHKRKRRKTPFLSFTNPYNIRIEGGMPARYTFDQTYQGVKFTYRGPTSLLLVFGPDENTKPITIKRISDNERVLVEGHQIKSLVFLATRVTIEEVYTLDLFDDQGLEFDRIATLNPNATFTSSLQQISSRLGPTEVLDSEVLKTLLELGRDMKDNSQDSDYEEVSAMDQFLIAISMQWKFATLFGFGFVDGPAMRNNAIDEVVNDLMLEDLPGTAVVYRVKMVYTQEDKTYLSNLTCCQPVMVPPLPIPATPVITKNKVHLTTGDLYLADIQIQWQYPSPLVDGVVIEQYMSGSQIKGSQPTTDSLTVRSDERSRYVANGEIDRKLNVDCHDVRIQLEIKYIDNWDRESDYSPLSQPYPLELEYLPPTPTFVTVIDKMNDPRLKIPRIDADANSVTLWIKEWEPDHIIENDPNAKLHIYRQTKSPRTAHITIGEPILQPDERYAIPITTTNSELSDIILEKYEIGRIIVGSKAFDIVEIVDRTVYIEIPYDANGSISLFSAGDASLKQSHYHEELWTKVHELMLSSLNTSSPIEFDDAIADLDESLKHVTYKGIVESMDRLSAPSNLVQIMLPLPQAPSPPPPFTIAHLGVDNYGRSIISATLTSGPRTGKYAIWWATGEYTDQMQFYQNASPGFIGDQDLVDGYTIYDMFLIPTGSSRERTFSFGLQTISANGKRSDFIIQTANLLI